MAKNSSLIELRATIKREVPFVGIKQYSHNIITLTLNQIDRDHGTEEVNKAIRDFGLDQLGWSGAKE